MFGEQCWGKSERTGRAVVVGGRALACKRRYGKCSHHHHHHQSRRQSPPTGRRDQCPISDPETRTWERVKEECAKKRGKAKKGCRFLFRTGSEEWVARRTYEI
jgi:hypothetical protein